MDDLISRKAVLALPIYNEKNLYGNIIREYVDIEDVKQLPPIQPANCSEFPNNSDTISRQSAIDIVVFECGEWIGLAREISKQLMQLPSVEPKIIRCNECKWNRTENRKETTQWLPCRALVTPDDFSCICAERRTE